MRFGQLRLWAGGRRKGPKVLNLAMHWVGVIGEVIYPRSSVGYLASNSRYVHY